MGCNTGKVNGKITMDINIESAKTNLEYALAYAKQGWYVFPVHNIRKGSCSCGDPECEHPGKHPRTEHGHNDATADEPQIIEWWTETPDANIGIRTGKVSGISVLDIDRGKDGFNSIKEFDVPATLYSKTGGDGQHHVYQYDDKIPTKVAFRSGIDFRSDGGYIVAPPSNHISGNKYVWCDGNLAPAPAPEWMKIKDKYRSASPIPEIISDGQRNATLTSLAGSMRRRGASQGAIEKALLEQNKQCSPPIDEVEVLRIAKSISRYEPHQEARGAAKSVLLDDDQIDEVKKRIHSIPKDSDSLSIPVLIDPILKEIANVNITQGDAILKYAIKEYLGLKDAELKSYAKALKDYRKERGGESKTTGIDKRVLTANYKGLVDIVEHDGGPAFLMKRGENIEIATEIREGDILYLPPPKEQIPWLMPRGIEVIKFYELAKAASPKEADQSLYDDLIAYHKNISELPSEEYYDLLATWDLHTYLLDNFQYSPILLLFAVPEKGKTRTGKGVIYAAYRGIHVESLRDAYLVRVAHDLNASLFFDVKELWKKAEKNDSEDIILHRFEKGAKVPRVLYPERGAHQDIVYYSIFGPTIIATNEAIHHILETRAVAINMPESSMQFDNIVTPEAALPLKERLLAFRARHMEKPLPYIPKPARRRLGDILRPLLQILRLVRPERESVFLKLIGRVEASRLKGRTMSLEEELLKIIISLEHTVKGSLLPVKDIADGFNNGKSKKHKITYKKAGGRLSIMGFNKGTLGNGAAAIIWDDAVIDRMRERYGLKKMSVAPESSGLQDAKSGSSQSTDITDVSDVCRRV